MLSLIWAEFIVPVISKPMDFPGNHELLFLVKVSLYICLSKDGPLRKVMLRLYIKMTGSMN